LIKLNDPITAHKLFNEYHKELPRVKETIYNFETRKSESTKLSKLLKEMQEHGISAFTGMEYIIPVIAGARQVSSAEYSEFLLNAEPYDGCIEQLSYIAKYLWVAHQIILKEIFTYEEEGDDYRFVPKLYIYKDVKFNSIIDEFRDMYYNLLESGKKDEAAIFLIGGEGKILGYPPCCIESAKKYTGKKNINDMRKKLSEELVYEKEVNQYQDLYLYFTHGFYPCSVNCGEAKKTGKKIMAILNKVFRKEKYLDTFDIMEQNLEHIEEWDNNDADRKRDDFISLVSCMIKPGFWNQEKIREEMYNRR